MGFFDDFAVKTGITDEDDRKIALELATKYPGFRSMVDETDTKLRAWEDWKDQAWDAQASKTKDQVRVESELDQARARVTQLEAAGGGFGADMTFEEIDAQLKAKGYVAKADIPELAAPLIKDGVNKMGNGIEYFYERTFTLGSEHQAEFGAPLDGTAFMEKVRKAPGGDPRNIYNEMVAPLREQKRVAAETKREEEHQAALKLAREEGERAGAQRAAMASGTSGMPVDQAGGTPSNMGPLQRLQADRFKAAAEAAGNGNDRPLGSQINPSEGLAWLQEFRNNGGAVQ